MKNVKRVLTFLMVNLLVFMGIPTVFAAPNNVTIATGGTIQIKREVKEVTNPVTATFTYKVEEASNPGTAATNLPANFTITFNNVAPNASHVATQTTTLDMSAVKFNKLGDYKFKITEISSSDETEYPKDTKVYYIYVSVRNILDAANEPTDTYEATLAAQGKLNDTGAKRDVVFDSTAIYTYLELSNKLTGNMADIDEYFAYNITIPGKTGAKYKVTGDHSTNGTSDVTTSECNAGVACTIYLKHGQSVQIGVNGTKNQIPVGVKYNITETGAATYETYIDGSTTNTKVMPEKTSVATNATTFNTANKTAYVNHKEENPLTGVFLNILPFVILLTLGFVGVYYIRKSSQEQA